MSFFLWDRSRPPEDQRHLVGKGTIRMAVETVRLSREAEEAWRRAKALLADRHMSRAEVDAMAVFLGFDPLSDGEWEESATKDDFIRRDFG
ncbi:hypothetical protein Skr01_29180 [Sphaerisporangium krabiense]|nr:hypothetical protein Skr01_29180 [Sphaerisporangium krabiense]